MEVQWGKQGLKGREVWISSRSASWKPLVVGCVRGVIRQIEHEAMIYRVSY